MERTGDLANAILICEAIQQGHQDVPSDDLVNIGGLSRRDGSQGRLELSPRVYTAFLILNRHLDCP
jgi:hypothetical protein